MRNCALIITYTYTVSYSNVQSVPIQLSQCLSSSFLFHCWLVHTHIISLRKTCLRTTGKTLKIMGDCFWEILKRTVGSVWRNYWPKPKIKPQKSSQPSPLIRCRWFARWVLLPSWWQCPSFPLRQQALVPLLCLVSASLMISLGQVLHTPPITTCNGTVTTKPTQHKNNWYKETWDVKVLITRKPNMIWRWN